MKINKKRKIKTLKDKLFERVGKVPTYNLKSVLTFGQYKTSTIEELITYDIKYIQWCLDKKMFELDNETFEQVTRVFEEVFTGELAFERDWMTREEKLFPWD
jgi:hypothetical protein